MQISRESWYKLCSALSVSPDSPIKDVVKKATVHSQLLAEKNYAIHLLYRAATVLLDGLDRGSWEDHSYEVKPSELEKATEELRDAVSEVERNG